MRATVITLISAIALGVVAALGVFVYTSGADARAMAEQQAVDVVVTTQEIAPGTTLAQAWDEGFLEATRVPASTAPTGYLPVSANRSQVAQSALPAGQIVFAGSFGAEAPVAEPIALTPGTVALSVELGDPQRVGTFLRPGSSIAIFNTTIAINGDSQTRLLMFGVPVLAVGSATAGQPAEDQASEAETALVTIGVTPAEAERVVHAAQTGALYLALLDGDSTTAVTPGVTTTTLYADPTTKELP